MGENSTVWLTKATIKELHDLKEPKDTIEHVIKRLIKHWKEVKE